MPGVTHVGLEFQRSFSSAALWGAARDARSVIARLPRSANFVMAPARVAA
jgi:hypothetical protein